MENLKGLKNVGKLEKVWKTLENLERFGKFWITWKDLESFGKLGKMWKTLENSKKQNGKLKGKFLWIMERLGRQGKFCKTQGKMY